MIFCLLVVCLLQLAHGGYIPNRRQIRYVDSLVHRWAPLIWLAPGEKFFPGDAEKFFENVVPLSPQEIGKMKGTVKLDTKMENASIQKDAMEMSVFCDKKCEHNITGDEMKGKGSNLPFGASSKEWFLVAKEDMGSLLQNSTSFVHGYNPLFYSVPVYAIVSHCSPNPIPKKSAKPPPPPLGLQFAPLPSPLLKIKSAMRNSANQQKEDDHSSSEEDVLIEEKQMTQNERQKNGSTLKFTQNQPDNIFTNNMHGLKDDNDEAKNKLEASKIQHVVQNISKDTRTRVKGPSFTVTYWLFFPFSEGKEVCVVETGPRLLGPWPFPLLGGHCLGKRRRYGSHLGDWEHLSIHFVDGAPHSLYISTHKLGAYYKHNFVNQRKGIFRLYSHELRDGGKVEGWLQRPRFPPIVYLSKPLQVTPGPNIPTTSRANRDNEWMRPTLFAAKGSHGLWAAPGHHQYVRYPKLEDTTGYGTPWATWTNLEILHRTKGSHTYQNSGGQVSGNGMVQRGKTGSGEEHSNNVNEGINERRDEWPFWMSYEGHWGAPRNGCHEALSKLGVGGWSCEYSDGPKGIPSKKNHFSCSSHR